VGSNHRKDLEKLLAHGRAAGFDITAQNARSWKVANPITGQWVAVSRNPGSSSSLTNDKAKLKKVGLEPGCASLKIRQTALAVDEPEPDLPEPAAAPEPPTEPPTEEPDMSDKPASLRVTGKGTRPEEDLPGSAWFLWSTIHETKPLAHQTLEGVTGYTWRGSLTQVISDLWPTLSGEHPLRADLANFLRATGNAFCLKPKDRPPLWFVTRDWIDVPYTPPAARPTRTERRLTRKEAGEDRPPAVVQARPTPAPASASDPLAALTQVVERQRNLEKLNDDLVFRCELLEEKNQKLQAQATSTARARALAAELLKELSG
jgi:hypothetical protein